MAISECDEHIEVRIKRPPADSLASYFEEYGDSNASGHTNGKVCESYIVVGEHDSQYLIEVILKPGFKQYGANTVRVEVWLGTMPSEIFHMDLPPIGKGGLQDEQILHVQRWRVTEDGYKMSKHLAFSRLETAPGLETETTLLGLDTTALGTTRIEIQRSTSSRMPNQAKSLTSKRNDSCSDMKRSSGATGRSPDYSQGFLIEERLEKTENGGITHYTKLLDEGARRASPTIWYSAHGKPPHDRVGLIKFDFKYRTQDTLEALGIVKKPPPLWEWRWDDINILDRPKVFKQLQKDNKMYEMKKWEMKIRTIVKDQQRPELKAYSKIHNNDRKRLFEVLQEKNKAYTRRDGCRDIGIQVNELRYEQGPEGWEKHGDRNTISAKKQEHPTDAGNGSVESRLSAPTNGSDQVRTRTVNCFADVDPFSAAPAELIVEQTLFNINQDTTVQEHDLERSGSFKDERNVKAAVVEPISMNDVPARKPNANTQAEPDIARKQPSISHNVKVPTNKTHREQSESVKHESIVGSELVVKSESSTFGGFQDQGHPSKRQKLSGTSTQSAKPGQRLELSSTTIDIASDVPIVEPKTAFTIDLTAESSPLDTDGKLDDDSAFIPARGFQPWSKPSSAVPVLGHSRRVLSESSRSTDDRGTVLGPVKPEPTNPSDTTVEGLEQPGLSSVERVRPTPTEAAERGECTIQ